MRNVPGIEDHIDDVDSKSPNVSLISNKVIPDHCAQLLTDSNLVPIFTKTYRKRVIKHKLPPEFKDLRVEYNLSNDGRLFGDLTGLLKEILAQYNDFCNFTITRNFLNRNNSRKHNSNYWTGKLVCQRKECPVKATLLIISKEDTVMSVEITGKINHDTSIKSADQLRGKKREDIKREFQENPNKPPSKLYKSGLAKLKPDIYASGNRKYLGTSPNVLKKVKQEALGENHQFLPILEHLCKIT